MCRCYKDQNYKAPNDELLELTKQPKLNFAEQMSQTKFCLSAPGLRGGDSDRYLPAILFGCIPVLLPEDDVMPFQDDVIPWDKFSVRHNKSIALLQVPRVHC